MLNPTRPDQQPEVILEKNRRKRFLMHRGRTPRNDLELQKFDEEMRIEAERLDALITAENEKEREQLRQNKRERDAQQLRRLRTRYGEIDEDQRVESIDILKTGLQNGRANFSGIKLVELTEDQTTHIEIASLDASNVNMKNGTFSNLRFGSGSNLSKVDFSGSIFRDVIFDDGSSVEGCNFTDTKFYNTSFRDGSVVTNADFKRAFLDENCSLEFDANFVSQANFEMRPNTWQRLMRAYTGVTQFLNIVLGFLYFGPLIFKISFLGFISGLQKLEGVQDTSTVWLVVMGGQDFNLRVFSLGLAILVYQGLRVRATMSLSPLIDAYNAGGRSPSIEEYQPASVRQRYINAFGYVVFAMFLYDLFVAATAEICIPLTSCF
ncbi:hypothetical protein [Roseobacter sp. CCS2]|uniref:hypothetical protein n=1 Tax=Roseobacter sp. CCS2 TaxID=391593 RepID=UPI0000F3E480|nr:hypothetical protein [Roseobacter sp. CCS2]EBA12656.1 hypothetical protein RCCS2_15204 [Roseobacter sp. CCS2]